MATLEKIFEKDEEFSQMASHPLPKLPEFNIFQLTITPIHSNLQIEEFQDEEF